MAFEDCELSEGVSYEVLRENDSTLEMVYAIVNELDFMKTVAKPDSERIPFIE